MHTSKVVTLLVGIMLSGCAGIDFGDEGLTYYDPTPYMFVSTTDACVTTATVVVVPEQKRHMTFRSGLGSSDLSATLANGMIASVGQKVDTKIPETITAIAGLGTAAKGLMTETPAEKKPACKPSAVLYPVKSGRPDITDKIEFPVSSKSGGGTDM